MKVFVSSDFTGHYPVGTAAVVTAQDEELARLAIDFALKAQGLKGFDGTLHEIDLQTSSVYILRDGNY